MSDVKERQHIPLSDFKTLNVSPTRNRTQGLPLWGLEPNQLSELVRDFVAVVLSTLNLKGS